MKATRDLSAVNLNLLRTLDALVELRSVSLAATRLGVTQSAVSHALRHLRAIFEDPLLVRTRNGMIPTCAAERLATRLHGSLAEIEAALAADDGFDPRTAERTFTIAAGDHMAGIILQAITWMGLREAPGVSIRVIAFDPQRTAADLERVDVDLAIGPPLVRGGELRQHTLFTDRLACIVRQEHAEIQGRVEIDQLQRLPHVVLGPDDESMRRVDQALRHHGVSRRVAVELPYFLLAPALVPFSDLLLIAPHTLGALFALGYPLQVLDLPIPLPKISVNAYWHERAEHDPAQAWLREQVRRCVKEFFRRTETLSGVVVGSWPALPPEHRA